MWLAKNKFGQYLVLVSLWRNLYPQSLLIVVRAGAPLLKNNLIVKIS